MNNRGFLQFLVGLPAIAWILGALGVGAGILWLQGLIINAIVACLLVVIGLFMFGKFVDSLALSDSMAFPLMLMVMAMVSLVGGIMIIKPDLFGFIGPIKLMSIASADSTGTLSLADTFYQDPFEPVPIAKSAINSFNPLVQFIILASILFALYFVLEDKVFK